MANDQALRYAMLGTTILALPFAIAANVVSLTAQDWYYSRDVTTFCFSYIPLAATFAACITNLLYYRKHKKSSGNRYVVIEVFAILAYLGILLPIWITEIHQSEAATAFLGGHLALLMMFNMFIHSYFFVRAFARTVSALFGNKSIECPNCRSNIHVHNQSGQSSRMSQKGYSLLRGEEYVDDDAEPIEAVRASEETICPDENEGGVRTGKAIIDV